MSRLSPAFALLLLILVAACSTRSVHTDRTAPHANLTESTVTRLISIWEEQVRQYVDREGDGDPAVLSRTRALRSRDVPRPGRITFGVLDVDSDLPGRNGWDVQGLLVGKQANAGHTWFVFLVGIVQRSDYRPTLIREIRLVALSAQAGKLSWARGGAQPQAVQRYLDSFAGSDPVRFPGDSDRFRMMVSGNRVQVQEAQSGAGWSLRLGDAPSSSGDRMAVSDRAGPV